MACPRRSAVPLPSGLPITWSPFLAGCARQLFPGGYPGARCKDDPGGCGQALQSTQSLRLEYILPDEDSTAAVLCYLPDPVHTFYVDAKTGKLVDLTELEELMYKFGMGGATADTAAESGTTSGDNGLSEAGAGGHPAAGGVLSSTELDKNLRAVPEYGLDGYTLASARFSVGETAEDGTAPVTCVLRYSRADGEDVLTRTFTMDARTGQVQTLYSTSPGMRTTRLRSPRRRLRQKQRLS